MGIVRPSRLRCRHLSRPAESAAPETARTVRESLRLPVRAFRLGETEGCAQLITVHYGHVQAGDHQVVVPCLPPRQSQRAVAAYIRVLAEKCYLLIELPSVGRVIFGDKDAPRTGCPFSRGRVMRGRHVRFLRIRSTRSLR